MAAVQPYLTEALELNATEDIHYYVIQGQGDFGSVHRDYRETSYLE